MRTAGQTLDQRIAAGHGTWRRPSCSRADTACAAAAARNSFVTSTRMELHDDDRAHRFASRIGRITVGLGLVVTLLACSSGRGGATATVASAAPDVTTATAAA